METRNDSPTPPALAAAVGQEWLAVSLAVVAGYVDAYGLMSYGTYVSFMSGNTTQTGLETGRGDLAAAAPAFLAVVYFVLGVFTGTLLAHSKARQVRRWIFAVVAGFLALVLIATELGPLPPAVGIATLSLAMGILNTALSKVGAEAVSLTFVTGTLSKLGGHLALALKRAPLTNAQGSWDTHLRRALLLMCLWGGFLTGAVVSGSATPRFGEWVLLGPLAVLTALALFQGTDDRV
jgi:uncharacterized membrane protein YoaK (UPF0700 family)